MQATRSSIRTAAELAARMELGKDHLDAGEPCFRFLVDGDAAAVVVDLHRVVRMEDDLDVVAESGQCLIHRVVDDFPEAVHQAAGVSGTDIHAGALADGFEALQYRQVPGSVIRAWCHW
jgi:hypothetical protein